MRNNAFLEARRIKSVALGRFSPGQLVSATFKGGYVTKTVRYFNVNEIPPRIRKKRVNLYLYSVKAGAVS